MANVVFDFSLQEPYIDRTWTYKDIFIPFQTLSGDTSIKTNTDYDAVKGGIRNIFNFLPGQRILYPDFGNTLYKYLYEPINSVTSKNLESELRSMLLKWEPRIEIKQLLVKADEDNNEYQVSLTYRIKILDDRYEDLNFPLKRLQ